MPSKSIYLLYLEMDLSLSTGYSINERESALALLNKLGERLIVLAPKPALPGIFDDKRIHYIYNHKRHHPLHYVLHLLDSWRQIRKLINKQPIRAVVARPGLWPIVPLMLTFGHITVILKTTAITRLLIKQTWKHKMVSFLTDPTLRQLLRRAEGIDTMTPLSAKLGELHGVRLDAWHLIPNGANVTEFRPFNREEARRKFKLDQFRHLIGYVGAMATDRHLDVAIEAMTILIDVPNLALIMVGGGPDEERLRNMASDLGVRDRVIFVGLIPYKDVPEMNSCFNVCIDLLGKELVIDGKTHVASYSMKTAQYLACGTPTVTWDTDETQFVARNGLGAVVPFRNTEDLAAALRAYVREDNDAEGNSRRCREYAVANLSYEVTSDLRSAYWDQLTASATAAST